MSPSDLKDFTPAGREQLRRALTHAAMKREHTAACAALREDPGATCVCRPPYADAPRNPTAFEHQLAVRGQR